ncbi:MAG: SCP2 sterol-binding domain-containing protein [Ardenticatenia bacterium]|nr:SCP2 sterol-binding domain-containing protein [Ardenticatenia bacterium]
MPTLEEIFLAMPEHAVTEKIKNVNTTVQFIITGDEPGEYVLRIADGNVTVEKGRADDANLTITSPSDVWKGIVTGDINGAMAFMTGKFKASGDLNVLMQMQNWFTSPRS